MVFGEFRACLSPARLLCRRQVRAGERAPVRVDCTPATCIQAGRALFVAHAEAQTNIRRGLAWPSARGAGWKWAGGTYSSEEIKSAPAHCSAAAAAAPLASAGWLAGWLAGRPAGRPAEGRRISLARACQQADKTCASEWRARPTGPDVGAAQWHLESLPSGSSSASPTLSSRAPAPSSRFRFVCKYLQLAQNSPLSLSLSLYLFGRLDSSRAA